VVLGILAARHFAPNASETIEVPSPVGPIPLAAVGSTITVRGHRFEVQGIVEPETNQLLRSCVLVPLEAAQAVLGRPETVSAVLITPERTSDIEPLQASIERDFADLMVINDKALAKNAGQLLERVTQLFNVVRWTAVAVAALLITIVMFVSVLERTKEIGTLRAIGAPARAVFSMVIAESLVIATLGAMLGVPLSRDVTRRALGPDAVGIRSGRIELTAVALLTSFGLVSALLPAARAVRVDPIVALRYE
jgi:putative ABC transport system permease protein